MDPLTLSTAAIAIATPYLLKGGEALVGEVVKDLWGKIKEVFVKRDDVSVLHQYIQDPNNPKNQAKAEYVLESEMKDNQTLTNDFSTLIEHAQAIVAKRNHIEQSGIDNILINDVSSSNIKITKK